MSTNNELTIEEAMLSIWPYIFGDLVKLKGKSEDWLSVLSMPLRTSIDSQELEELLGQFFSDVSEGHAELVHFLKPNTTKRITTSAEEIQVKPVRWLVENVIKHNAIHLFAGDPNAGKSFITLEIASQISRGGVLFGQPVDVGKVLLFGSEDSASDTVVPRLISQGADLSNIRIFNEDESLKLPDAIRKLSVEIAYERPKVVVIDTINSFIGEKTDTNSDKGIRNAILPLKKMADYYNVAFVLVTHQNKSSNNNAMYRINGSIGYVGLSRLVWLLAEDPDTEEKIFSVIKNNIGKKPSFKFDLDFSKLKETGQPLLKFLGETEELAQEIGFDEKTEPTSVVDECAEEILNYLAQGRKESSVVETYMLNTYSLSCYKRARKSIKHKINTVKEGHKWFVELVETLETDD